MKKICIVTGTRAEYGLLKGVIEKISNARNLQLQIIVTGMHLMPLFGLTYQEIEDDGYLINEKIYMGLEDNTEVGITKSMGNELIGFADAYNNLKPDIVVLPGDRYEMFIAATAAVMAGIPSIHLFGGELTVGAIDDVLRHCITKMSYLHFASTEVYRKRIIQLGEEPSRVFCFGDLGVENINNVQLLPKSKLEEEIDFSLEDPFALVTFHPTTLGSLSTKVQTEELFCAINSFEQLNIIFTKANSDLGGQTINDMIDLYVKDHPISAIAFTSMGQIRYLSAMKYAAVVIGNSSSGIVEAPTLGVPTVNIGDRQEGRLKAMSVINCEPAKNDIKKAITLALSDEFRKNIDFNKNPYKGKNVANRIVTTIETFLLRDKINLKKRFYDL